MCHSALSVPRAKTSIRPSELTATAASLVTTPPSGDQADQGPAWGFSCQRCHTALSVPTPNISRRPSTLRPPVTAVASATAHPKGPPESAGIGNVADARQKLAPLVRVSSALL